MTDDTYPIHVNEALKNLAKTEGIGGMDLYIGRAQAHALLALAAAVTRLVDSYNGWKDIGK